LVLGQARQRRAQAMTLIYSALADGDCIEDADRMRVAATSEVLGHGVRAPSTLGTFPEVVHLGHVAQLDPRARRVDPPFMAAGAGPGEGPVTLDVDSTICETYGLKSKVPASVTPVGVAITHSWRRLPAPKRSWACACGAATPIPVGRCWLLTQVFNRVRRAGQPADGAQSRLGLLQLQGDPSLRQSGGELLGHGQDLQGIAQGDRRHQRGGLDTDPVLDRRRRRCGRDDLPALLPKAPRGPPHRATGEAHPGSQLALFSTYDYHAFITDREGETIYLEADHRRHAVVEDVIRDLKYGVGVNHLRPGAFAPMPSG